MGQSRQRGFSLIELIVVIAIIGVLAAAGLFGYNRYIYSAKVAVNNANANEVFRAVKAAALFSDPKQLYQVCGSIIANAPDYVKQGDPFITPTPHNCLAGLIADIKDPFANHSYALNDVAYLYPPLTDFFPLCYQSGFCPWTDPAIKSFQRPLSVYHAFPQINQIEIYQGGGFQYFVGNCANAVAPQNSNPYNSFDWGQNDLSPFFLNSHLILFPLPAANNVDPFMSFDGGTIQLSNQQNQGNWFGSDSYAVPWSKGDQWALVSCDDAGKATQILPIPSLFDWSKWNQ